MPIALKSGASQAAIDAVSTAGSIGPGLSAMEQVLIELTDAMTREIAVPDQLYERVRSHCDERQVLDAMVTIGAYNMVSRFLEALQIGH